MEKTTKVVTSFQNEQHLITGEENYKVFSADDKPILSQEQVDELIKMAANMKLTKYFSCIEKAKLVAKYLGENVVCFGSLFIESTEEGVSYGYGYNPPLELHAWVLHKEKIVDLSIAGTIEKGLIERDDIGPFLKDREPVVLAGIPANWMKYRFHHLSLVEDISIMDKDTALEILKIHY